MWSYGKRLVKLALGKSEAPNTKRKRYNPDEDAKYWCLAGLDKDGLEKKYINRNIGYGVFASEKIEKGTFLLEYVGERISPSEDDRRKRGRHHYSYLFKWNDKKHVIDATNFDRLCKFVNDEESGNFMCNSTMKLKIFNSYPRLCLFANRQINKGEEVRYDYGEKDVPWRKKEVQYTYYSSIFLSNNFKCLVCNIT
ncbi:N-lysine methyltransferase KMT5A-A-like [Crassostrea virginica]